MKIYRIATFHQPRPGYGWEPCSRKAKDARFFVFSAADSVRGDRLHGRDFRTYAAAEAAVDEVLSA